MKYKIQNKLECPVKVADVILGPKEVKILNLAVKPTSDRLIVEKIEELEKKVSKGGKK